MVKRFSRRTTLRRTYFFARTLSTFLVSMTCVMPSASAQTGPVHDVRFDVVSVREHKSADGMLRVSSGPDGFTAIGATLQTLVEHAYGVRNYQILGAPRWFNSNKYDVRATFDQASVEDLQRLPSDKLGAEIQRMLQTVLTDRFKLTVHRATKRLPVYVMTVAKSGTKLRGDEHAGGNHPAVTSLSMSGIGGPLTGLHVPIPVLTDFLSTQLGRTVLDETGLSGHYDFTLKWRPENMALGDSSPEQGFAGADSDASGPSMFTAIEEQLGLMLKAHKGPVDVIVIDHVEKPSTN